MTSDELIQKKERIKEIKRLLEEKKKLYDYNKAMQLALKLVINGTYGAFANKHFVCSNADIANAITAHGRDVIQYMLNKIENYFYNEWHLDTNAHRLLGVEYIVQSEKGYGFFDRDLNRTTPDKKELHELLETRKITVKDLIKIDKLENDKGLKVLYEYRVCELKTVKPLDTEASFTKEGDEEWEGFVAYKGKNPTICYGDTDSLSSDSLIITKTGDYTIEDLYNKNIKNGSAGNTLMGHESVNCEDKVLNWDETKKLYYAPVKRIIRHKVTKEKWKLKTKSGKEIIVTNDHSMIVFRDGVKLEIKPKDILKTDKILIINKKHN